MIKNFIKNPANAIKTCLVLTVFICSFTPQILFAEKTSPSFSDTTKAAKPTYPKTVGYLSFILPLETLSSGTFTPDFNGTTKIGFPIGVNVLYSEHFGFSYEITPTIKATNSASSVSNILFDPGTMFRFEHGFTFISRLAFETSGRYGFTPVFNQIYARTKFVNYFVAGSLPVRFGANETTSIGFSLQIGFIFN